VTGERIRACGATLVGGDGEVSDDSRRLFDVDLTPAGCGNLVCRKCVTTVVNETSLEGRRYHCGCSTLQVTRISSPDHEDGPPWGCGFHAPAELPIVVDGVVIGQGVEVVALLELAVSRSTNADAWLSRIRRIAEYSPAGARIDRDVPDALTHRDVRVRALAVACAARADCQHTLGDALGWRIVSALREHADLFAGVPAVYEPRRDGLAPGETLEDQLVGSLARTSPWKARGPKMEEFLHEYFLEPGRCARLPWFAFFGMLADDRDWTLDHMRVIVDATPEVAGALYEAVSHTTNCEQFFPRVDVRVLRQGALESTHYKTTPFTWLAEHDTEWATANLARVLRRRGTGRWKLLEALLARRHPELPADAMAVLREGCADPATAKACVAALLVLDRPWVEAHVDPRLWRKAPPSPPLPEPVIALNRKLRTHITMTAAEAERLVGLKARLGDDLRRGFRYGYSDQDSNWAECVFDGRTFVWTSGYSMNGTVWPPEKFDDEDALAAKLLGGVSDGKGAIQALEQALAMVVK
jgi:hypothetical protein